MGGEEERERDRHTSMHAGTCVDTHGGINNGGISQFYNLAF